MVSRPFQHNTHVGCWLASKKAVAEPVSFLGSLIDCLDFKDGLTLVSVNAAPSRGIFDQCRVWVCRLKSGQDLRGSAMAAIGLEGFKRLHGNRPVRTSSAGFQAMLPRVDTFVLGASRQNSARMC